MSENNNQSPAAGAKIKRDVGPVIPAISNTQLIKAANTRVLNDTGIQLSGSNYENLTTKKEARKLNKKLGAFGKAGDAFGSAVSDKISGLGGIGGVTSMASSALQNTFVEHDTTKNKTGYEGQQAIGNFLMKTGNPILMGAGAAWNTLSTIAENTNGNVHTITDQNIKDLGLNKFGSKANNFLANIPGIGWAVKDTSDTKKSPLIDEMSNAYSDSVYDINSVNSLGDSNFIFGRSKIQKSILEANKRNELLTDINLTNTMRKQSDYAQDLSQQNLNRYMGTNYMDMRMGKQGMKFPELDNIREILKNRVLPEETIQKFADGGSILPTGKLHKELHHMDQMGEQYEDLTRKGIPVVTLNEGGEITQVAEIEKEEICLSKEITDQLEALWKDGSEEAMIEAGKLIANEILYAMKDDANILGKNEEEKDGDN